MVAFREVGAAIGLGLRVAGVARRFCLGVGPGFVAAGARGGCHGVGGRAVLVTLGGCTPHVACWARVLLGPAISDGVCMLCRTLVVCILPGMFGDFGGPPCRGV